MPQLKPTPWFAILTFSWLIFLTILLSKTMSHPFPNELTPQSATTLEAEPWNWPWY